MGKIYIFDPKSDRKWIWEITTFSIKELELPIKYTSKMPISQLKFKMPSSSFSENQNVPQLINIFKDS
jgi:hypothetical protein